MCSCERDGSEVRYLRVRAQIKSRNQNACKKTNARQTLLKMYTTYLQELDANTYLNRKICKLPLERTTAIHNAQNVPEMCGQF